MLTHMGTIELETERLIMRRFKMEDAQEMFDNWATDPEVTKYLTWQPHESLTVSREVLAIWVQAYEQFETYQWAMVVKKTGRLIGSIGVVNACHTNEHCEVGYCISRQDWGQGYMTEALRRMMDYLFHNIGYERISAIHYIGNDASGRVMEKAGMTYEGTKRNFHKIGEGAFVDCKAFAAIKSEWSLEDRSII